MGGGGDGHSTTYKGLTMHQPKRWHTVTGKGMCALMWVGDILGRVMKITLTGMAMEMDTGMRLPIENLPENTEAVVPVILPKQLVILYFSLYKCDEHAHRNE
ncbi:hypothetical protein MKW92_004470 [Papaver armeniacum]|nr:hypothetical protein MKW92_004470 [Papaver armeniacum]